MISQEQAREENKNNWLPCAWVAATNQQQLQSKKTKRVWKCCVLKIIIQNTLSKDGPHGPPFIFIFSNTNYRKIQAPRKLTSAQFDQWRKGQLRCAFTVVCRHIPLSVIAQKWVWIVRLHDAADRLCKAMQKRLEATEMWFLRRMMRVSWTDHVTNEDVLERTRSSRTLLQTIAKRQICFLGHILRKNALETVVFTGAVEGRRARGRHRQRLTFLSWLKDATGTRPLDIIRRCQQKEEFILIRNVRFWQATPIWLTSSRKPSFATCMSMACCKASKAYRQSIGLPTAKLICKLATTAYKWSSK